MPKIIRVSLTPQQRIELNQRARARSLSPRMRDRLEMIRLSDLGQTIPQIASLLQAHQQTVRKYLKRFIAQAQSFDALADAPIPGRPPVLTEERLRKLEQLLDRSALAGPEGRSWTCRQLAGWLREEFGVKIHPKYLSERLKERRFRWKRTVRSVRHKQKDPNLQAEKKVALETLNL
jgi:transposase